MIDFEMLPIFLLLASFLFQGKISRKLFLNKEINDRNGNVMVLYLIKLAAFMLFHSAPYNWNLTSF